MLFGDHSPMMTNHWHLQDFLKDVHQNQPAEKDYYEASSADNARYQVARSPW